MNNDLISRSALIENYERFLARASIDPIIRSFMTSVRCTVEAAPAVDAEPVRHGIWEPDPYRFVCSECHKWFALDFNYSGTPTANMNYCPHCGARMEGEGYAAD